MGVKRWPVGKNLLQGNYFWPQPHPHLVVKEHTANNVRAHLFFLMLHLS